MHSCSQKKVLNLVLAREQRKLGESINFAVTSPSEEFSPSQKWAVLTECDWEEQSQRVQFSLVSEGKWKLMIRH